jgi:hypothetical protein
VPVDVSELFTEDWPLVLSAEVRDFALCADDEFFAPFFVVLLLVVVCLPWDLVPFPVWVFCAEAATTRLTSRKENNSFFIFVFFRLAMNTTKQELCRLRKEFSTPAV